MRIDGECELCGKPGHGVQVKAQGGRLSQAQRPKDSDRMVLCYECLYSVHGFKTLLWPEDEDRQRRAAARRERIEAATLQP